MSLHENIPINICRKYVSRKVKTVRWKPSSSLSNKASIFITGSWGDEENNISVWHISDLDTDPTLVQEIPQHFEVNDIQYVTRDLLAAGDGNGNIYLHQHKQSNCLEFIHGWEKCHTLKSGPVACTALASNGEQLVSVGEDGKIFVLNPEEKRVFKIIDSESECSDYAVTFVKASEILTGNMQGHLKLWDLRSQKSLMATLLSPDQFSVRDLSRHPTQYHLIAAAGEDGSLSLWDMRSSAQPLVLISAHSSAISQVRFHPTASDHLFTCGVDGKVFHWDASSSARSAIISSSKQNSEMMDTKMSSNAWFSEEVKQGLIDAVSLIPPSSLPINSLDIDAETLLAGSDNESVYVIRNALYE